MKSPKITTYTPEMLFKDNLDRGVKLFQDLPKTTEATKKIIHLDSNVKCFFEFDEIPCNYIFDVRNRGRDILIVLNSNHPASKDLYEFFNKAKNDSNLSQAFKIIELFITSWAKLENNATIEMKHYYEDVRQDWGRVARDILKNPNLNSELNNETQ